MNNVELAKIAIFLFGLYHFIVGVPSVMSLYWLRRVGSFFYKLKISNQLDPQFEYVLKPLGLYALFTSLVSLYVATQTSSDIQRTYLLACAFLLVSRGICRLVYAPLFLKAFGTTAKRNQMNAYFTFAVGGLFLSLYF